MLYLYDPRYNLKTETTLDEVAAISGVKRRSLSAYKVRGNKVGSIGCYLIDEHTTRKQIRIWYEQVTYPDEHWVELIDHPDYKISNYGRVKRADRFIMPTLSNNGSIYVVLHAPEKKKFTLAILVAKQFIGPRKHGMIVYHKNGISSDNHAANLTYMTREQLGRKTGPYSRVKPVVQYDPKTFKVIREFRSVREAARETFVSHPTVYRICRNEGKRDPQLHFMYEVDYIAKFGEIGGEEHAG